MFKKLQTKETERQTRCHQGAAGSDFLQIHSKHDVCRPNSLKYFEILFDALNRQTKNFYVV